MKLSSKQALVLFELAKWTVHVSGTVCGYDEKTRLKIINEIINQQSDEVKELGDGEKTNE